MKHIFPAKPSPAMRYHQVVEGLHIFGVALIIVGRFDISFQGVGKIEIICDRADRRRLEWIYPEYGKGKISRKGFVVGAHGIDLHGYLAACGIAGLVCADIDMQVTVGSSEDQSLRNGSSGGILLVEMGDTLAQAVPVYKKAGFSIPERCGLSQLYGLACMCDKIDIGAGRSRSDIHSYLVIAFVDSCHYHAFFISRWQQLADSGAIGLLVCC